MLPDSSNDLKKKAVKDLAKKSSFLIGVNTISISASFLETYLFSRLGIDKLAASVYINASTKFFFDPFLTITDQNAVFISKEYGKTKKSLESIDSSDIELSTSDIDKNIGNIIRQGWYLALLSSIPSCLILFNIKRILVGLSVSEQLANIVEEYFIPFTFAVPLSMFGQINTRLLASVDQEKWLLPYRIIMTALKIGLDIFLISKYGPTGAGLSVLLQAAVSTLGTTLFIIFKKDFKKYQVFNFTFCQKPYILKMLKQGGPMLIAMAAITGANFAISLFVGKLGDIRLAIEQVVIQFCGLGTTIAHGINEASNRLVGQALGIRDFNLMRLYGNFGTLGSALLFSTFGLVYNIIPFKFASLFMDQSIINNAESLIRYNFIILVLGNLFKIIQDSAALNLAGMQDTLWASVISFVTTLAVILPLSAISLFLTNLDVYGISGSITIGLTVSAGVTGYQWLKQSNKAVKENSYKPSIDSSNVRFTECLKKVGTFKICSKTNTEDNDSILEYDDEKNNIVTRTGNLNYNNYY